MKKTLVFLIFLGCGSVTQAQTALISLSEDSAQFKYAMLAGGQSFGRSEFGFGFLYNSEKSYVLETGLHVIDEAGASVPGLQAGIGGKLYGASIPNHELLAIGIGGLLRYALPGSERFAIALEGSYAPEIVSFMDAANFREFAVRGEYEVLQQAALFVEFRKFEGKLDSGANITIDEGGRVGLRVSF